MTRSGHVTKVVRQRTAYRAKHGIDEEVAQRDAKKVAECAKRGWATSALKADPSIPLRFSRDDDLRRFARADDDLIS
jgi:hypothetical protein